MEVPTRQIQLGDVIIDRLTDKESYLYHRSRYQECLRRLISELYASDKVNDILQKYSVEFLTEEPRIGCLFPEEKPTTATTPEENP